MKKCPMCRLPFDKEDINPGDRYVIEIRNGPRSGERIEFPIAEVPVYKLAEEVAAKLGREEAEVGSIYRELQLDPSRLVFYRDGAKLESRHIPQRSHSGKLSVQVEGQGWNHNVQHLATTGHSQLVEFFLSSAEAEVQVQADGAARVPYELGLALKLCMSLLEPVATRGGSIIDEEIDNEILEVLTDARDNGRSLYEALRYEFF